MGISLASSSRGQLPPPHTLSSTSRGAHALICYRGHRPLEISSLPHALSHLPAVVLMRSSAVVGIVLSRSAPSQTLSSTSSGAHALICCRGHRPLVVCSLPHTLSSTSRGAHALICCREHRPLVVCPLPHTLSHLPAVVLMRSSAIVGIVLSRSAPSQTLSSTSCGAHALICCRGHRPLVVCSLPPLSHLPAVGLMRSSVVVGIVLSRSAPSQTLSSTSCGAHALICCRGHRPLVVCSLPPLSHLPAVGLMRSSVVVGIVLSRSAPSQTLSSTSCGAHVLICCRGHRPLVVCPLPHTHSHLPAVGLMRSSAVEDIVLSRSAPSPTLSHLLAVVLSRVGERVPSPYRCLELGSSIPILDLLHLLDLLALSLR